jgi:hypothetical protein
MHGYFHEIIKNIFMGGEWKDYTSFISCKLVLCVSAQCISMSFPIRVFNETWSFSTCEELIMPMTKRKLLLLSIGYSSQSAPMNYALLHYSVKCAFCCIMLSINLSILAHPFAFYLRHTFPDDFSPQGMKGKLFEWVSNFQRYEQ